MNIIKILTLASLTGTALMGGVFYATRHPPPQSWQ
jgi:hypothetical protein